MQELYPLDELNPLCLCPFLSFFYSFLEFTLPYISIVTPAYFLFPFSWSIFFCPFVLVCVCLFNWGGCLVSTMYTCLVFLIYCATLYVFIDIFNCPLTFEAIIDRYIVIIISLIFLLSLLVLCYFPIILLSSLVYWWVLIVLCLVLFFFICC